MTGQAASIALPDEPAIAAAPGDLSAPNSLQGSRPIFDPFKPRPKFGIAAGSADGSLSLNGSAVGFGVKTSGATDFRHYRAPAMGGRQGNLATFFPTDGFATGQQNAAGMTFGNAPATLPTLNQLMRANLRAPLGSNAANFRLSYQERFGTIGSSTAPDFGHMLATGMFASTDLGNGMFLSAGTGSGHAAGAPAATLGTGTVAQKHAGSSVAIKLSF